MTTLLKIASSTLELEDRGPVSVSRVLWKETRAQLVVIGQRLRYQADWGESTRNGTQPEMYRVRLRGAGQGLARWTSGGARVQIPAQGRMRVRVADRPSSVC